MSIWSICRVDKYHDRPEKLFEVQAAYRKQDLNVDAARKSGFVAQGHKLVIVSPTGRISDISDLEE